MWVDFHSHKNAKEDGVIRVYSLSYDDVLQEKSIKADCFTIGFHPWWIGKQVEFDEEIVLSFLQKPNCLGLGEIGLDRSIPADFEQQKEIFTKYFDLAKKFNVKVIVLHCVRAYSDVLQILKNKKPTVKIIFHDYNGNAQMTEQLLKWDCYFSVGQKIFDPQTTMAKNLRAIPLDRLFLETDDQDEVSIQAIYQKLALLLNRETHRMQSQILQNFLKITNN